MPKNLTPRKRKALEALLTSGDISQAANTAGVSRDSVYRWLRDPDFQTALSNGTQAALQGLSQSLLTLGAAAAKTLQAALEDTTAPLAVKLRAADIVLTRLLQMRELVDLDKRLTELEKKQNEHKATN